ncbi:hypothetical protein A2U01_0011924 [Trifolium medium]|uniref:Uncharacterized protein n=1 Tax=Trifolium medium TaxID=97028 RepID=A0A392MTY2_9FABA|nr:hypothetical protein [Trifolium medium]
MAKIGIKTLKNRIGTKVNAAGSPPKPTKSGSLGDAARAALLELVKGVFKNKTVLERLVVGGFGVFSNETFLDLIAKLVHDDYVKRIT